MIPEGNPKIIPTKIRWLKTSVNFPIDMRVPTLYIAILRFCKPSGIRNLGTETGRRHGVIYIYIYIYIYTYTYIWIHKYIYIYIYIYIYTHICRHCEGRPWLRLPSHLSRRDVVLTPNLISYEIITFSRLYINIEHAISIYYITS